MVPSISALTFGSAAATFSSHAVPSHRHDPPPGGFGIWSGCIEYGLLVAMLNPK
jgi:hypothetical protein